MREEGEMAHRIGMKSGRLIEVVSPRDRSHRRVTSGFRTTTRRASGKFSRRLDTRAIRQLEYRALLPVRERSRRLTIVRLGRQMLRRGGSGHEHTHDRQDEGAEHVIDSNRSERGNMRAASQLVSIELLHAVADFLEVDRFDANARTNRVRVAASRLRKCAQSLVEIRAQLVDVLSLDYQ